MYTHLFLPNIIYPTRIVENARPSLIDNIYSNCINREIISGNLIEKISDHMPNFLILQDLKKSELRIKYQKRDYSKFNAMSFELDLKNDEITQEMLKTKNVNSRYTIFQEHFGKIMNKHAPIRYLSKKEVELKMNPWLTKGILKSIKIKTRYYKKIHENKE